MKIRSLLFIIGLFTTILTYGQTIDNTNPDSICFDRVLKEALNIVNENLSKTKFNSEYTISTDYDTLNENSFNITVNLVIGHLFADDKKHVLIRLKSTYLTYLYIYHETDKGLIKVIERLQEGMTYLDDTTKDVNGDNFSDLLVHWYPESGCCRRNVYNVFLYQPETGNFTSDYEFINPTFSEKEKLIRGIGYGHPGEVGLYKYKWNGLLVDTIEYIYPNQDDLLNRTFLKTNKNLYSNRKVKKVILKTVPTEYFKIESYDWFTDY